MRIYVVKTNGEPVRYVRAANQAAAIKAVVNERFSAVVATTEDIYAAAKAGTLEVLDAAPAVDDGPVVVSETREVEQLGMQPRHNSRMPVDA